MNFAAMQIAVLQCQRLDKISFLVLYLY